MNRTEFDTRLRNTRFVLEATSAEMQMIWEKFSDEAIDKNPRSNTFKFEQMNPGISQTLGKLDKRPVCISLFWWRIDGIQIMTVDATSQVVDHEMIEKWLDKNCAPHWDGGRRLARCNAENINILLDYVRNEGKITADEAERLEALRLLDELQNTHTLTRERVTD